MRIKHFAGYGSVNAVKIKEVILSVSPTGRTKRVIIKVTGNHEWGLYRNDFYDIYNWLMKRLCKDCKNYNYIFHINTESTYERINNIDNEVCIYTIDYII